MPGEGCIMPGSAADSLARDARKFVFDYFVEQAVPPVLEQIMERYRLRREEAFAVLKGLEEARHLKLVPGTDRKSTRLNSSHGYISYAGFCFKKKNHDG